MDSPMNDTSIEDRLREVYEKTDAREYAEALDTLEMARATDPGNIYVAALRRQLDGLLSLSQADELTEDQRRELMEPMPGIIDCAVRDNHRQHPSDPPARAAREEVAAEPDAAPAETAGGHGLETGDVSKELEALKLLYFQRASKFVMKGEYEQALAEVRRVFVVDPENTIAREYASRVEHLLQHARRLASEPMPGVEAEQESSRTAKIETAAPAVDPPHVHTERSTAWDADFVAPKTPPAPVSERRPSPPNSRQTVAYGDSLAVSLSSNRNVETEAEHPGTGRKKSRLFLVLGAVILTPLLAGVAVAIFSTKSGPVSGLKDTAARQTQNTVSAIPAEATIGAAQNHPAETAPLPKVEEQHQAPPVILAKVSPPAPDEKSIVAAAAPQKTDIPAQKTPVETPKKEVAALPSPAPESAPPPQPKAPAAEPAKASDPAFVAVEKDPQIVKLEKPQFPSFVWKIGVEGQVVVRVLIDANGKPLDSQILKSTNPVFEQPVVDAVMKSQFNPAQMGQGPVAAWLTIPFKFRQPR
jgi:protein TonB